jgi:ribosome biogenesis GTPase / thiamine phosphate phosphatase
VAALASQCRFGDCTHTNEPECAIQGALAGGQIDMSRWRSYCKLQRELRHEALKHNAVAGAAEKAKWKAIHKDMRNHPKYRH